MGIVHWVIWQPAPSLLLPTRGETDEESEEPRLALACPMRDHSVVRMLLKFLQIIPLIAQFPISKTVGAVPIILPIRLSMLLIERHHATLTIFLRHMFVP